MFCVAATFLMNTATLFARTYVKCQEGARKKKQRMKAERNISGSGYANKKKEKKRKIKLE